MYLHGISELPEAQGGVKQGPRRSQEVRGSPELQKGGLRALEEAWIKTSRLRYFSVKCLRFLCFGGVWRRRARRRKRRRRKKEKKRRRSCRPREEVAAAISLDGRVLDASGEITSRSHLEQAILPPQNG